MDATFDKIKSISELSGGCITTKQIVAAGISRPRIKPYVDAGVLIRVRNGCYTLRDSFTDEYSLLQTRCSKAIYSYGTALYFWGLSDRVPHTLDLTVPQGANVNRIKQSVANIRFHYVAADVFELGKTMEQSPQGGQVILYDKERCICDVIRSRKSLDMQLYTQAIKDYFQNRPNLRKLLKYGKQMGIEAQIRTYMEVLT